MASHSSALPGQEVPSLPYTKRELRRIPSRTRERFRKLQLSEDLEQELHLSYYLAIAREIKGPALERALHAAGERFRYHNIVQPAKYEVPEALAGASYHRLMYGTDPEDTNA
jgi:hypothetical protein